MAAHSRTIAFMAACLCACTGASEEERLAKAETLCLDQNYEAAIPLLRDVLFDNPFDPGAHYYLGLCYMAAPENFRPLIAKGEFETALRLFKEQGKVSPIERFSAEYFEMMCHINQGKTTLREIDVLMSMGARPYHIEPLIENAREHADAARGVLPDAEEVAWLDRMIAGISRENLSGASGQKSPHSNGN